MKKLNFIKISLDILMSIIFVLLFNKMAFGSLKFHEHAGLFIGFIFIIHILLNLKWIKQITSKFFKTKMTFKTRLGYIIDILLLFVVLFIIISGILISKVTFSNINIGHSFNFKIIHISLSYFALLLIGIHVGLHWTWIINTFKKIFKISNVSNIQKLIFKILTIIIIIFGIYNIYSTNYFSKIIPLSSNFNNHQGKNNKFNKEFSNTENKLDNKNFSQPKEMNNHQRGQGLHNNENGKNSNVFNTIFNNLSIMLFFSIITSIIEKFIKSYIIKNKPL